MKKIYCIYDTRLKEFVTDIFTAENDRQANMMFENYVQECRKNKLSAIELRLYFVGKFDASNSCFCINSQEVEEVPLISVGGEDE